jgi:hypothetical protein
VTHFCGTFLPLLPAGEQIPQHDAVAHPKTDVTTHLLSLVSSVLGG